MRPTAHRETATLIAHPRAPTSSWWVCGTDEAFVAAYHREQARILSSRLSAKLEAALDAADRLTQFRIRAVRAVRTTVGD